MDIRYNVSGTIYPKKGSLDSILKVLDEYGITGRQISKTKIDVDHESVTDYGAYDNLGDDLAPNVSHGSLRVTSLYTGEGDDFILTFNGEECVFNSPICFQYYCGIDDPKKIAGKLPEAIKCAVLEESESTNSYDVSGNIKAKPRKKNALIHALKACGVSELNLSDRDIVFNATLKCNPEEVIQKIEPMIANGEVSFNHGGSNVDSMPFSNITTYSYIFQGQNFVCTASRPRTEETA